MVWNGGIDFTAQKGCIRNEEEYEMNTEERNEKEEKAETGCCGIAGSRMFAMMSACCADKKGVSDCSTMMKDMMEKMKKQSCCAPTAEVAGQGEGKP